MTSYSRILRGVYWLTSMVFTNRTTRAKP